MKESVPGMVSAIMRSQEQLGWTFRGSALLLSISSIWNGLKLTHKKCRQYYIGHPHKVIPKVIEVEGGTETCQLQNGEDSK